MAAVGKNLKVKVEQKNNMIVLGKKNKASPQKQKNAGALVNQTLNDE